MSSSARFVAAAAAAAAAANAAKTDAPPLDNKRALGDITNLHNNPHNNINNIPLKPSLNVAKPRRAAANAVARRAKLSARIDRGRHRPRHIVSNNNNNSIPAAVPATSSSPMSTSTNHNNTRLTSSFRLSSSNSRPTKPASHARAAALAAAVSCKLDFAPQMLPPVCRLRTPPPNVIDIDAQDRLNHLVPSEYACDIYSNFLHAEQKFMPDPTYMTRQADITVKMRAILIDWLVDVHQKFNLQPDTLHLTVNLIDRFLGVTQVVRRKLQLVGVTAMFIASKYEEIYAPEIADFVYITDKAYTKPEILAMEAFILNALNFDVTVPSTLTFMQRCLKAANAITPTQLAPQLAVPYRHLTHYLIELALQDTTMLEFRPSIRAAAACRLSARLCRISLPWDRSMTFYSGGWTERDVAQCEAEMIRLLEHERDLAGTNKLTAVKRKFSSIKFSAISTLVPRTDSVMDCSDQ